MRPSSSRRFLVSASPKNAVGNASIQLRPEAVSGSTLCQMLRILQRYATNIANCSVLLHGAPCKCQQMLVVIEGNCKLIAVLCVLRLYCVLCFCVFVHNGGCACVWAMHWSVPVPVRITTVGKLPVMHHAVSQFSWAPTIRSLLFRSHQCIHVLFQFMIL